VRHFIKSSLIIYGRDLSVQLSYRIENLWIKDFTVLSYDLQCFRAAYVMSLGGKQNAMLRTIWSFFVMLYQNQERKRCL
jgi:hypothetical protein